MLRELKGMKFKYINKRNIVKKINDEKKYDDFLRTINSVFMKARYFGVSGFGFTFSFGWCLLLFAVLMALECVAIGKIVTLLGGWLKKSSDTGLIGRLAGAIFYGNALISLLLSSKFVHSWVNLSSYWLSMETNTAIDFPPDARIRKRTICITVLVASCAVVEHALSMVSATGIEIPPEEFFYKYLITSHGFLLRPQDFNLWYAIPVFIISKVATALWNFQDLIIILISMGLSSRYNRLNLYVGHMITIEKQLPNERLGTELYLQLQLWRHIREAYVRQSTLVRMVDRKLGSLVLLSNINNLYFICLQIYLGLHKVSENPISRCYFLFSLGWLLFRACSVVIAASDVHIHSRRALKLLHSCPTASYNIEIKRLQYQLAHDIVSLTGMGFFSLRRELLLEVAATILKYELVLIQYDK